MSKVTSLWADSASRVLWHTSLGIAPGSWVATGRKHQEAKHTDLITPWARATILVVLARRIRPFLSKRLSCLRMKCFCLYRCEVQKQGQKTKSLLILPNLGQSSLFYVVKHSSLRMWDVRQLKHFFLFGSGLSPFWGDPEKIGSSEGRTLLWNIHYNLQL